MSFLMKTLAKEVLDKYPCNVHICINPYYWQLGNSICDLGDFNKKFCVNLLGYKR